MRVAAPANPPQMLLSFAPAVSPSPGTARLMRLSRWPFGSLSKGHDGIIEFPVFPPEMVR